MCALRRLRLCIRPVWPESSQCAQWVVKGPMFLRADSEDWSDWADAQADLSLRWAHMPFCWFCHEAAQFTTERIKNHVGVMRIHLKHSCDCFIYIEYLRAQTSSRSSIRLYENSTKAWIGRHVCDFATVKIHSFSFVKMFYQVVCCWRISACVSISSICLYTRVDTIHIDIAIWIVSISCVPNNRHCEEI